MKHPVSDAIVFFGATGDLAYKQIFPALQGLIRDEGLAVPIIGVAKAGWSLDQLKARAKDSLCSHGGPDIKAFAKLTSLLRYVDGDYNDPQTYVRLRQELKDARQPLHYLAIPPSLFATVAELSGASTGPNSGSNAINVTNAQNIIVDDESTMENDPYTSPTTCADISLGSCNVTSNTQPTGDNATITNSFSSVTGAVAVNQTVGVGNQQVNSILLAH